MPKKTERLFSGNDYVIKSSVTEEAATDFTIKLLEIGCECSMDLMPFEGDISRQPDFVERRTSDRRRRFRRGPRPGAVIPDRRLKPSNRRIDLFLLERDGDFPGNTVKGPR
ncbi:MAG: hypothetical protein QGI31_08125 [Dehalococcoidia bacterium]|jgi:hypothetical protein|nr:hypothetical protein [Dehalococcoidia bacterium]